MRVGKMSSVELGGKSLSIIRMIASQKIVPATISEMEWIVLDQVAEPLRKNIRLFRQGMPAHLVQGYHKDLLSE